MPSIQQTFWKIWYQYISSRIGNDPVTFLNYGYWPPEGETLSLKPEDESNRPAIQLYHHVASGADITAKNVLEVSCGHGGGASFVKRYHHPAAYTAVDQNPKAIAYCQRAHHGLGIDFRTGDAQALDFPSEYFDAVLNVEASHCYPRQEEFFRSVYRVLKPGGYLLFADLRLRAELSRLNEDIAKAGFQVKSKVEITEHVVRSLQQMTEANRRLVRKLSPKFLHSAMETFAGVEGSGIYNSFIDGERLYYNFCLVKPIS